ARPGSRATAQRNVYQRRGAMKLPGGLTAEEAALWARVTATVPPLNPLQLRLREGDQPQAGGGAAPPEPPLRKKPPTTKNPPSPPLRAGGPPPRDKRGEDRLGLDSSWERKLSRAAIAPDFTLDLHGHSLDQAHRRL